MKPQRIPILLAACGIAGTAAIVLPASAWAAEPAPATPAVPAAATATAPPVESAAANGDEVSEEPDSERTDATPPARSTAGAGAAGKGSSPERFVPSEQVRADFDVSFPIDI